MPCGATVFMAFAEEVSVSALRRRSCVGVRGEGVCVSSKSVLQKDQVRVSHKSVK